MLVTNNVLNQIRERHKQNKLDGREYGGYLIVEDGNVTDLVFDEQTRNWGYVQLGLKELMKLPLEERNLVRGWFHRHPINGYSGLDAKTMVMLTKFWGECYTVILQSNGSLLVILSKMLKDLQTREDIVAITEQFEIPLVDADKSFFEKLSKEKPIEETIEEELKKDLDDTKPKVKIHVPDKDEPKWTDEKTKLLKEKIDTLVEIKDFLTENISRGIYQKDKDKFSVQEGDNGTGIIEFTLNNKDLVTRINVFESKTKKKLLSSDKLVLDSQINLVRSYDLNSDTLPYWKEVESLVQIEINKRMRIEKKNKPNIVNKNGVDYSGRAKHIPKSIRDS